MKTLILIGIVIAVLVAVVTGVIRNRRNGDKNRGCEHCADQAEVERTIL
ncbi:MAG: hypothetical protein RBS88_08935 [Spongiibacteraceae bacterium]|jgi:hypothetical protein|nr:hypothetical protein [Spongiibacteraceae bacterium]